MQAQKKEMLKLSYEPSGRPVFRINYSSLEAWQTCKRKGKYLLLDELRANDESQATLFGSAIHKGLEAWYCAPIDNRKPLTAKCDAEIGGQHDCARCAAVRAFLTKAAPLDTLDPFDKRHPSNGIKILDYYISKYISDPFEVARDSAGAPLVERTFEFPMWDTPQLKIIYFGTIDVILKNVLQGITLVCDHKTTSSLGTEFYKRIKPNHQYTGYVMGAREVLGIDTELFLVNGLQVAKTKVECARQITTRTAEDFEELRQAVKFFALDYLEALSSGHWPQSAPNPCSMYGGCSYHAVCEAPATIRAQVIRSLYNTSPTQTETGAPHGITQ